MKKKLRNTINYILYEKINNVQNTYTVIDIDFRIHTFVN